MASSSAPRRGCASVAFASRAEVLARRVSSTTDSTPFSGRFLTCDAVTRLSTRARESHPDSTITPSVVVYRLDDRLFFANASYVLGRVPRRCAPAPTATCWLLFGAEGVAHVDAASLDALADLADGLRREEVALVVARMKDPVRRRLDDAGVTERIGAERFYQTVRAAVKACAREDGD
jgi:MFS superfamily sulfate permease-like transporter